MRFDKRVAIPLAVIVVAVAVGGWLWWRAGAAGRVNGHQTTEAPAPAAAMAGHVSLTPAQRVMANAATVAATEQALAKEISAAGVVQYDQSRQAKVTAWVAGRLDRLRVNAVGAVVGRNQPIAEVYSPELLATQQEYLLALKGRGRLTEAAAAQEGDGLVQAARQRLLLFGVREAQLAELERSGAPRASLPIYTPLAGVVIDKLVQQGQYVNPGDVLFTIADLSTVWVEVEVYEQEFAAIAVGQPVEIRSRAYPDRAFAGRIALVYPFLDPKTRTIRVRVVLPNPDLALRPEMFVNAVIKAPLAPTVVVPSTAVLDTGKRRVVWVETSPGMFEPRPVQTGTQAGGMIQILSGIAAGEMVAVSGGYLIDSESQLQGGGGQDHSQHTGAKPAVKGSPQPVTSPPSASRPQASATKAPVPAPSGHEGHGAAPSAPPAPPPPPTGHEGHGGAPAANGGQP